MAQMTIFLLSTGLDEKEVEEEGKEVEDEVYDGEELEGGNSSS